MSCFLVILFLSLTISSVSEARHGRKHPSAVVVGTVYCDTCFQQDFSMSSHFISGASVAVECKDGNSKPRFKKEAKTNDHGEFQVELPFSVSKHMKRIKRCTVKLINSSEPYCAVASTATSSSLRLKSRKQGEHIFSAGFFSFKPLKQPNLCYQKPSIHSLKSAFPPNIDPTFAPPIQDPAAPPGVLTPLPKLPDLPPLPELPPLPPLPRMPWLPLPPVSDRKVVAQPDTFPLPPNPFLVPPPSIPNPNPLQPPALIPNPLQPPSTPPLIPNPNPFPTVPVPGLSPPSSPPVFPFPFPPVFPPPIGPPSSKKASP
ncbi:proline-rich extensin-like protein EPR1 [Senna tora]|uniref:Proline-rich extensin-like protein EPR1 n=1 Tax=Senna tora TaxID=362788 RepID=A0A834SGP2_9FABA|nr:proline-rich extensin-like protein EPR1 [Senna tora]